MSLPEQIVAALDEPLDPAMVSQRDAGGSRKVSYLEGHHVIAVANQIFGYGAWGHTVDRLDFHAVGENGFYSAVVSVTVDGCALHQDVGVGTVTRNHVDEHDKAIKTAVTDALKRALRVYGDQFGNGLYDRDGAIHDQVKVAQRQPAPRPAAAPTRPAPPAQPQRDPLAGLRADVAAMLEADHEAASKLPKTAAEMTEDELHKTLAWLKARADSRGKQQSAPQAAASPDRPQPLISEKQLSQNARNMLANCDNFPTEERIAVTLADAEAMVDSGDLTRGELEYIKRYAAEAVKLQADMAGVK